MESRHQYGNFDIPISAVMKMARKSLATDSSRLYMCSRMVACEPQGPICQAAPLSTGEHYLDDALRHVVPINFWALRLAAANTSGWSAADIPSK